jgi:hypothetical protein
VHASIDASPKSGDAPLEVGFSGTQSTGDNLSYTWDFGDDSPPASGVETTHTYSRRGTYTVTLTVGDGSSTHSTTQTITVAGLRAAETPAGTQSGLAYSYYEGAWASLPDFSSLTETTSGTVSTFDISQFTASSYAVVFAGYVEVPESGQYTFYTNSNDGTKLYIGNDLLVDNDGQHAATEVSGQMGLAAGMHAIRVEYFQNGGTQTLEVLWEGPGISSRSQIPGSNLYHEGQSTYVRSFIPAANRAADRMVIYDVRGRVLGELSGSMLLPTSLDVSTGIRILKHGQRACGRVEISGKSE